ncbi:FAD dependent oxidoreductase [Colletotrichum truncatum]|uniref:FAD dependent oxidoreductase n=1 Tax=Colletotrichum truncatum TaxID=5467 RepID=A0ACC3YUS9_COLTU|nr:FAD dependent oxidoreductase [Colletotrichum truncatum]KAF6785880.1 FAD dependent oxidoreductase [Colletotrichum truncatum]
MKSSVLVSLVSGIGAGLVGASPLDELLGRQAGCPRDNCLRAVLGSRPGPEVAMPDCSSWMQVTVTPCASTVTQTATVTSFTTTVGNTFPGLKKMKREELEGRQVSSTAAGGAPSCTPSQNGPGSMPDYVEKACQPLGTLAPAARYSTACSCGSVTARTTTLPASSVVTVTTTTTVLAAYTPTNTPTAFVLQATSNRALYVSVDSAGALRLVPDASVATPFYVDNEGQMRNYNSPNKTLVNYYEPDPATANDKVYSAVQGSGNYRINCFNVGRVAGAYYGGCTSSGSPTGNPVVHGFGYCPNHGGFVYMIPNNSNVRCFGGGYAFAGFYLATYSGQ